MTLDSTEWTAQSAVSFNAGSIADTTEIATKVGNNLSRTISATSTPTSTEVADWVVQGKQALCEEYGFTWKRKYVYADTVANYARYSLPADYSGGASILRDLTQDKRLILVDLVSFNTMYPDPEGQSNAAPSEYCIRDRELWLKAPADGVYRLELEYERSGDDSTSTDITYIPDIFRAKIVEYCTYKAFLRIQNFQAASMYKAEWEAAVQKSKKSDKKRVYEGMNYMAKNWHYVK